MYYLQLLYRWFEQNKRDLPWRQTTDPYKIWISEIVLQQTQVSQGISYYNRFIKDFPSIHDLANSPEDKVLKAWQGLGYYSRARNLHYSSKLIVKTYKGIFPSNYKNIISLKGVGEYTAAAIASIAFNQPYATVDGNVARFIARYFEIDEPINTSEGKKSIKKIAEEILDKSNPGMHNQALMEFGALQCTPKNPNCIKCPLNEICLAFNKNIVGIIPVKNKTIKQKVRFLYYFLIEDENSLWLQKRKNDDIWKNLWQLPLIETETEIEIPEILKLQSFKKLIKGNNSTVTQIGNQVTHFLTHQKIIARLIKIKSSELKNTSPKFIQINKKDISKFAVPKLIEKFLTEAGLY